MDCYVGLLCRQHIAEHEQIGRDLLPIRQGPEGSVSIEDFHGPEGAGTPDKGLRFLAEHQVLHLWRIALRLIHGIFQGHIRISALACGIQFGNPFEKFLLVSLHHHNAYIIVFIQEPPVPQAPDFVGIGGIVLNGSRHILIECFNIAG